MKGVYPSLLFTFAVLYALMSGYWEAVFIGVLSGFLQDVYFVNVFGVNMLVNMLVCLIAAYIGESVFKHKKNNSGTISRFTYHNKVFCSGIYIKFN